MAWIDTIDENAAQGELADLYGRYKDPVSGEVDNILKAHSLSPEGLKAHLAVYLYAMRGTKSLPKAEREMIALIVSDINGCHY